ncbi:unnamed protein product [Rhizoctonia solani]|nr:unnamed protein product [Rhizoctonia solani]
MSSKPRAPKQKKGLQRLFRNPFNRPSSHLSTSTISTEPAPRGLSTGIINVAEVSGTPDELSPTSPTTISALSANPQPDPSPPNEQSAPVETNIEIRNEAWVELRSSLRSLGVVSRVFPNLASAAGILLECFDGIETAARSQQDYENLAREVTTMAESLVELITAPTPPSITKCISGIAIEIKGLAEAIEKKGSTGAAGRILVAKEDEEEVVRHYRRIQSLFRQLQVNLSASTWSIANEHLVNARLKALNPVKLATYDSTFSSTVGRRFCTEGTRTEILSNLDKWLYGSDAPAVYWMNGMAGTGKTTIACSFSETLEQGKRLAASFFCTRTTAECRDVTRIIPSIAYQLARYSSPFQSSLYQALSEDPDAGSRNIQKQFERLLRDPLLQLNDAMPDNLVVVIDALDECEDRSGVETTLDMLFQHAQTIPLKFFVTSRPEPEIYNRITLRPQGEVVHLHEIEKSPVQADIELYLKAELALVSPSTSDIEQLVQRSGALFICAATLVRYIQSDKWLSESHKRLKSVLSITTEATEPNAQIDTLYTAILNLVLNENKEDIRVVLRTVLFAQEPIDVETITMLSGIDEPRRVLSAIQPLRSILHQPEPTGVVSTLHASFSDFMFNRERSGEYFCDIVEHSQALAERCFLAMKKQLRFNICRLESSFIPDDKVDNIQERIRRRIPATLAYACRHWGSHLGLASKSDSLMTIFHEFISNRLLFWMEVLNLRRDTTMGLATLLKAQRWLNAGSALAELGVLVEDAHSFVKSFGTSPASESTPHIYISSLPLCPRSSTVYKNYWRRTQGLLELKGSLMERREGAALATWDIGSWVNSVAYSPDGTRVAVACWNKTVRILNAQDGTLLFDPLQGHAGTVRSIAFSPDGKHVGSSDDTIRVWNAHAGALAADPFKGHTATVRSVSYSPDGKRIISGSDDHSICIWDASDGTLLHGPLTGHTSFVFSVAFSSDGTLIASASTDKTVRLWNAHDGSPAASPFEGHTNGVSSVAFTPDGTRLVSGSWDKTIRVWNTSDGSLTTHPFEGHTSDVNSVAVSSDGTRVASGSNDGTVRVWNIEDGTLIVAPLIGHTDSVQSVAFSPDGTCVISGSWDQTIRVWNVRGGLLAPPLPFQTHMRGLRSVFLSGNGTRILSGSEDSTIWAWDITPQGVVSSRLHEDSTLFATSMSLPSGTCLPVFAADHSIGVINPADGTSLSGPLRGHTAAPTSFGFSGDNTCLVTGSHDCTVCVWDLQKAKLIGVPFQGHGREVNYVALSPDHSRVVSCSFSDQTIRVWNTDNTMLPLSSPSNSLSNSLSDDSVSPLLEGWKLQHDGWVINSSSALLFWIPPDLASLHAWPSPHGEFIITKDGVLHIVQKELYLGDRWSRCYILDFGH